MVGAREPVNISLHTAFLAIAPRISVSAGCDRSVPVATESAERSQETQYAEKQKAQNGTDNI